jgi:hypothetical protein
VVRRVDCLRWVDLNLAQVDSAAPREGGPHAWSLYPSPRTVTT